MGIPYKFSNNSERQLSTMKQDLVNVFRKALSWGIMDITIVEGYRDRETQNKYFDMGKSRVKYPDGRHNKIPSDAGDAAPFVAGKVSWNKFHCCVLSGIILAAAEELGVRLRWGGNWDMDDEPITDQDFQDLVHYEVI